MAELMSGKTLHDFAVEKQLTFKEYFDLLIRSVDEPVIEGVRMPGFPDDSVQSIFVGSAGVNALREALGFYMVMREYCQTTGNSIYKDIPVLDFGCGWGRISRLFFRFSSNDNFWGVDVEPEIVDFCKANMGHGNYKPIRSTPPIDFEDNSFRVIFAYSVFSHLSEHVALAWIKEFARILKPGGILVATTQGRSFLDMCESMQGKVHEKVWFNKLAQSFLPIEQSKQDYDAGKFVFDSHVAEDHKVLNRDHYGDTLIPPQYIKEHYTPYLNLIDFVQDHVRFEKANAQLAQALFVMQKPPEQQRKDQ